MEYLLNHPIGFAKLESPCHVVDFRETKSSKIHPYIVSDLMEITIEPAMFFTVIHMNDFSSYLIINYTD